MKNYKFFTICILLLSLFFIVPSALAECQKFSRVYGVTTTLDFNLWLPDGTAHYVGTAPVNGDILVSQSEGVETACTTSSGNCVTDEGSFYSIIVNSAELDTARVYIAIRDVSGAAWLDKCLIVETYGNASAQFGAAVDSNITQYLGTAVPTADTAGYPKVTVKDGTGTGEIDTSSGSVLVNLDNATGTIDAAQIGTDAIGASEIAAAAITNSEFTATPAVVIDFDTATGTIDAAQIGTDAIGSAEIADGAIDAGALATDTITAAKIAPDAIGASEIAAAAITNSEFTATPTTTVVFDGVTTSEAAATPTAGKSRYGLAAAGIDVDDQFAYGAELALFDSGGLLEATSCIIDSANAGDTVDLAEDITSFTVSGDRYVVRSNSACRGLRATTAGVTVDVASTGEVGIDFGNVLGTLDSAEIGAGFLNSAKFTTGAIDANAIATDAITAAEIAPDAIGASELASDAIGVSEIAADAIGASEIAAAAITNSEFTATPTMSVDFDAAIGTIDAAQIGADAITGAKIASDAIGASELAVDAIGASELAADSIGASEIAAAAITNSEFTATISAAIDFDTATGTIDATQIATDAITAAKIAPDAIGASEIAAAAITNSEFTATVAAAVDFDTATGTLGAAQLEADTITAAKIAAGAITSSEFTATPTVGGINATALADLFDTNSGTNYAAAIGGSVVKEIADNAGGVGGGDFMITNGTAQSVTSSPPKMRLDAAAMYGNDVLNDNAAVLILSSSGNTAAAGQVLCISKNVSSNDEVTFVRPYKSLPSGVVTYAVIPAPNCNMVKWPKNL